VKTLGKVHMKEDPFRLNAKPEQKMESKMHEFFEGVKKNSETITKLGENLVFATAIIGFLLVATFGIHSCSSTAVTRAEIIECIRVCNGHENVQTYEGTNRVCRCRHH